MKGDISSLALALHEAARGIERLRVMEVCGTHTVSIARYALASLLPDNMQLVSGPGCPVCVTDGAVIGAAMRIAQTENTALYSFGDMLRVPDASGKSLLSLRGAGADVRIAYSPTDALEGAVREPEKQVVFLAVGFETTAPLTAAMLARAWREGIGNISVLCAHKTMPAALVKLLSGNTGVDALLCPGHVAVITGAEAFRFVPGALHMPGAVAGFEPEMILRALTELARMRATGEVGLVNCYKEAVTPAGNATAKRLIDEVFTPCAARWRGLGEIDGSGLALSPGYAEFDAARRFDIACTGPGRDDPACRCALMLRGEASPRECPLFAKACTPDTPHGPCMVSAEGACAAFYRYRV